MRRTLMIVAAVAAFSAVLPAQLTNQKKEKPNKEEAGMRTVQGIVRDPNDTAAVGAVVQLKNTKSLQVRSFITKEDGTYRFNGLSTNIDYELKAEYQGMASSPKTLSVFDDRKNAVLNLKLEKK